uniref:Uncharacterized protein n=1 Tax=Lepeophtheirus salmonis TaxID=72036 RepID=A0A0K2V9D0_LEPSM
MIRMLFFHQHFPQQKSWSQSSHQLHRIGRHRVLRVLRIWESGKMGQENDKVQIGVDGMERVMDEEQSDLHKRRKGEWKLLST